MGEIVKNQHYIPQNVLKHFADKGRVSEVLVEKNADPYQIPYRNSMSERFTYEHSQLATNAIENFFQKIEDDFGPAIVEVLRLLGQVDCGEGELSSVEEYIRSYLNAIIIYYYRSGALLYEFEHETASKENRISMMLNKLSNTNYINNLSETIRKYYDFAIIRSESGNFLISDQYISTAALRIKSRFSDISNRHLVLIEVLILVPLSNEYYAIFYHGHKPEYIRPQTINYLTDEQVLEINKVIINNSYKKCVGKEKATLQETLPYFEWRSPSAIYIGHNSGKVSGSTLKKEVFFYEKEKRAWELFTDPMHFRDFNNLGRNDYCGCGSNKKFKLCCFEYYVEVKRIWRTINDKNLVFKIGVHPRAQVEESIFSF
ncbi:DUF4238 domain-containing protein [Paenibacillus sonchi]|uniref:DUF4238 domain-containing protein n=1 Tax=Paenibacillus sonchi TaxID=373687 RepID=A0A974PBY2_9BACL|nr:DUF4238 domain-containing protein [Paenibacillus sonchi]QQZ61172.1 DUF4238 domain-containing protein [Paenibacillus sonchi]